MWPFKKRERRQEANSGEQIQVPTRLRLSHDDKIRQMIRHEMFRQAAGQQGMESFEEADDFEFDDGDDWKSPYENDFDPDFDAPPPGGQVNPAPTSAPAPSQQPSVEQQNESPKPA